MFFPYPALNLSIHDASPLFGTGPTPLGRDRGRPLLGIQTETVVPFAVTSKEQRIMTKETIVAQQPSVFKFEQALQTLESLVDKLGRGQLSLEEALASFEEGILLARQCQEVLKEAEQKVNALVNYQNPIQTAHFHGEP